MKKYLFAAIIAILFFGCSRYYYHTSGVITGDSYPHLKQEDKVKVVLTGEAPDFEVIGMVQVISKFSIFEIGDIVEEAQAKAREMGANIIALEGKVITKSKNEGTSGTTDKNGKFTEGTPPSVSEYPTYTFIAGRLK